MLFMWMEPQTPVVMIMSGLTNQPWTLIVAIKRLYLSCLVLMAWSVNCRG